MEIWNTMGTEIQRGENERALVFDKWLQDTTNSNGNQVVRIKNQQPKPETRMGALCETVVHIEGEGGLQERHAAIAHE